MSSAFIYVDILLLLAFVNDLDSAYFLINKMLEDYPVEPTDSIPHIIIESTKLRFPLFYYELFVYLNEKINCLISAE